MQLGIGKWYLRAGGGYVHIIGKLHNSGPETYRGRYWPSPIDSAWYTNGRYWRNHEESPNDLVAECEPPPF